MKNVPPWVVLCAAVLSTPAHAQDPLDVCVFLAEHGWKGSGDSASWSKKFMGRPEFNSVRPIATMDDSGGCDAIVRLILIDNFWRDRVTVEVVSRFTNAVVYRGPDDGWLIRHDYHVDYATAQLKPGGQGHRRVMADKTADCASVPPRTTPFCQRVQVQAREQQAAAARAAVAAEANRAAAMESGIRERIPAWLAQKNRPPLPEEARRFRVLAEDAIREKRFEDAAQYYERGLRVEPMWPEAHYNLAILDGELRKFAQAASHMRLYLEMVPNAKDAAAARDKVIIWEEKAKR
jgi:hypothetical protein